MKTLTYTEAEILDALRKDAAAKGLNVLSVQLLVTQRPLGYQVVTAEFLAFDRVQEDREGPAPG